MHDIIGSIDVEVGNTRLHVSRHLATMKFLMKNLFNTALYSKLLEKVLKCRPIWTFKLKFYSQTSLTSWECRFKRPLGSQIRRPVDVVGLGRSISDRS